MTAGMEVFFLSLLSMFSRRRLIVYDFLRPRSAWVRPLGRVLLFRVDRWLVIRSSDIAMLESTFGVRPERCVFVPFPGSAAGHPAALGAYGYAAGIAHRDWPTFLEAARLSTVPFIVSSQPQLTSTPPNVESRPLVPPAEGRLLSAGARVVVVPLKETNLPSGPLLVVDAQASGKAVIASDVGGTRDYIEHGRTGWLVPPGDAEALARMIEEVFGDEDLLERVGREARSQVRGAVECLRLALDAAAAPRKQDSGGRRGAERTD